MAGGQDRGGLEGVVVTAALGHISLAPGKDDRLALKSTAARAVACPCVRWGDHIRCPAMKTNTVNRVLLPSHRRRGRRGADIGRLGPFAFLVILGACGGAECVSGPLCTGTDPDPDPDPDPTVAAIAVTSPIDSVMAVGRTVQLAAVARDASGNVLTGTAFNWTSTNAAVATVGTSGIANGISVGTTTLRAESGGVTGSVAMRAVAADLTGIATVLADAFVPSLAGALDSGTRTTLNAALTSCSAGVSSGNVLRVEACISAGLSTSAANGTDTAVLAVLALFLEESERRLQLGR